MTNLHPPVADNAATNEIQPRMMACLGAILALLAAGVAHADAPIEFSGLAAVKKFDGANLAAVSFPVKGPRVLRSNRIDMSIGVINRADDNRAFVSIGPAWRVSPTDRSFAEFRLAPVLMAGSGLGHRPLGGSFFFSLSASAGYRFNERWALAVRAEHISNGGLNSTNPGLDLVGLSLRRDFGSR